MPPRSKANIVIKKTTSTTRARRPSVSTTTTATSRRPSEITTTTTTTTENDRTHGFGKEREFLFLERRFKSFGNANGHCHGEEAKYFGKEMIVESSKNFKH
jgi:hypothetical protein